MKLENIVPWGRNLTEYREMFLLTEEDLGKKILGCGDGPASFNSEVYAGGGRVVSLFSSKYVLAVFCKEFLRS